MGYRGGTIQIPGALGDGSDGDLHIQSDAQMSQAEYNLRSLIIDEGFTWKVPNNWEMYQPITIIRCQSPIVLNGAISAGGVGSYFEDGGMYPHGLDSVPGMPASSYAVGSGAFQIPQHIFPCMGGACGRQVTGSLASSVAWDVRPYPYIESPVYMNAPIDNLYEDYKPLIGYGKYYRYCIGGGGEADVEQPYGGGKGGAILCIHAPAIVFGANGLLDARGSDGDADTDEHLAGAGGGGGGYIETWTRTPLSAVERAERVVVTGGLASPGGDGTGFDGLDGVKNFYIL